MITVTALDVAALAPEFFELATETPAEFDAFIDLAREFVCESKWGTEAKAKKAICLMTAHLMKDMDVGGGAGLSGGVTAGQIVSEKVGDLSRTYAQGSSSISTSVSDQLLTATKYGKAFLMLRRTLVFTPRVV
jgi:hypothetical protein